MKTQIYFVLGPTASGKSKFALSLAKKLNGEIINADSMQIYKELSILTARPTIHDQKKINHHLYGFVKGDIRFNVQKWCEKASTKINYLVDKNITPILVGGTGLYIESLINGIVSIPFIPEKVKKESEKMILKIGKENFFNLVKEHDVDATKNISPNDIQRIRRIWEVNFFTKKKFSEWKQNKNKKLINLGDYKILLFLPERKENYKRVNHRTHLMIEDGAIDEVENLLKLNYNNSLPIMKAHGVPEIQSYLNNEVSIEECISKIQQVTRNYVKRQHTWWRSSNLNIFKKFDQFPDEIDIKSINLDQI
ncbi:tRNA (adenosine(37)-N6)-dimethylallyltransferase MiaA [Pelagibacteraceae bacterium]|nr:tRNA (adenosine(37)-N6)-dimethylallyltransferase MiaA [Pelagibacteraceae bacterium]